MKAQGWGDGWSAQCLPCKQEDLGSDPHSSLASHAISSMKDPMPISIRKA